MKRPGTCETCRAEWIVETSLRRGGARRVVHHVRSTSVSKVALRPATLSTALPPCWLAKNRSLPPPPLTLSIEVSSCVVLTLNEAPLLPTPVSAVTLVTRVEYGAELIQALYRSVNAARLASLLASKSVVP